MEAKYLKKSSVARFFDVSVRTADRWIEAGKLPKPVDLFGSLPRWDLDDPIKVATQAPEKKIKSKFGLPTPPSDAEEALREGLERRKAAKHTPISR